MVAGRARRGYQPTVEGASFPEGREAPPNPEWAARYDGLSLHDVLALGGLGAVRVLVAPKGLEAPVSDVVVHDPVGRAVIPPRALVAAVGLHPKSLDMLMLIDDAANAAATAVLVAADEDALSEELVDRADRAEIALLHVSPSVAWGRLLVALQSALATTMCECDDGLLRTPIRDLFDLANAVASLLGGAVVIEDAHGRVLAHSTTGEPIDDVRRETILQRRTPVELARQLAGAGVYSRLWRGEVVRHVADDVRNCAPRLGVALRTRDEVLGVIWVLEGTKPFGDNAVATLRRVADAAVVHVLRQRVEFEPARLARGEHLEALLTGTRNVDTLARELELDAHAGAVVVLLGFDEVEQTEFRGTRERMLGIAELHYQVLRRESSCVVIDDKIFAMIPDEPPAPPRAIERATEDLVERTRRIFRLPVRAAIGYRAGTLFELSEARRSAELAFQLADPSAPVADARRLSNQVFLLELREVVAARPELRQSKLAVLREHDALHGSMLVPTLRSYLDCFGDVAEAAARLRVHPNTLRYRLHRLEQLTGIDLADPNERLVVSLELRFAD